MSNITMTLVGARGSGKSILANCIQSMLPVTLSRADDTIPGEETYEVKVDLGALRMVLAGGEPEEAGDSALSLINPVNTKALAYEMATLNTNIDKAIDERLADADKIFAWLNRPI